MEAAFGRHLSTVLAFQLHNLLLTLLQYLMSACM